MDKELSRFLKRVPKNEMKTLLSKWGKLPTGNINYNAMRYEIINEVTLLSKECSLKIEDVHLLELLYFIEHPLKKLWKAHEMKTSNGLAMTDAYLKASAFQQCLKQKLYVKFNCSVQVMENDFSLWGRVSQPSSSQSLYFIHFPYSPFILTSKGATKLTLICIQALKGVLGYRTAEDLNLESSNPSSLAEILLHNRSSNKSYTFDQGCYEARSRWEPESLRPSCDDRVHIEHERKLRKTKKYVDKQFGSKLQPSLHVLQVSSDTRFRGQTHLPGVDSSVTIKCKTRFIGPNTLEGIRKTCLLELAHAPLPNFLTNAGRTGLQHIRISDRMDNSSRLSA